MTIRAFVGRIYRILFGKKPVPFQARGEGVVISEGCEFGNPERIVLEDYILMGENTRIYAQGG